MTHLTNKLTTNPHIKITNNTNILLYQIKQHDQVTQPHNITITKKLHLLIITNPILYSKKTLFHLKHTPYQNYKMVLAYQTHHKLNIKYLITNKWKPYIITNYIHQDYMYTCLLTRHNTHKNHNSHPKSHPYSKLNPYTKHKLYQRNKVTSAYQLRHPTNSKKHIQNKYSKHKRQHKYKHHPKLNYQFKFKFHLKNTHHPKNTTASAYRPRHTNNNTYHLLNNWKTNSVTNLILHTQTNRKRYTRYTQPLYYNQIHNRNLS